MNLSSHWQSGPTGDELSELCARAAAGDENAFERLHARLGAGLQRFLRKRVGARPEVVEDLAQRTWTAAWSALRERRYDPHRAAFTTFLYGIACKVWLQSARMSPRAASATDDLDGFATDLFGGDDPAHFQQVCELLDAVRAVLNGDTRSADWTPDERDILRGVAAGESERDMARRIGLAPSTINSRKRLALQKLRTYLGGRGLIGEQPSRSDE